VKIQTMRKGKEWKPTDDGMVLSCPICLALWLSDSEGDFEHGTCDHLRFVWWSGAHSNPPDFHSQWNTDGFVDQCLQELNRILRENEEEGNYDELPGIGDSGLIRQVLRGIETPAVDEAWEYPFVEEYCTCGIGEASGFFGVKKSIVPN